MIKDVAVLPFRRTGNEWLPSEKEFLVGYNYVLATDELNRCLITSDINGIREDAFTVSVREMKKRLGVELSEDAFIFLGSVKYAGRWTFLMAVDLSDVDEMLTIGYGWLKVKQGVFSNNPLIATAISRLPYLI